MQKGLNFGKKSRFAGFTLIEALIAVSLIGILAALTLPRLSAYMGCRDLDMATQNLVSDIRYTQQLAINAGYADDAPIYTLNFIQNGSYRYEIGDGDSTLKVVYLPKTVTWEAQPNSVRFNASGAPAVNTPQTIKLNSSNCNKSLYIMITVFTGRVRSSE